MKLALIAGLVVASLVAGPAAHAAPPSPAPVVQITEVVATGPSSEGVTPYRIVVEAVDPDGIIGEVVVEFGDGATVWLLLACTSPGEPVVLELDWSYAPGRYMARASGYSTSACFEGVVQNSRVDREFFRVG